MPEQAQELDKSPEVKEEEPSEFDDAFDEAAGKKAPDVTKTDKKEQKAAKEEKKEEEVVEVDELSPEEREIVEIQERKAKKAEDEPEEKVEKVKGDIEEESPAKSALDEVGKKLEAKSKAEGKEINEDGSVGEEETEVKEVTVKPITTDQVKEVFSKLDLTDDEKRVIEDDPDIVSIIGKFGSALFNATQGGTREVKLNEEQLGEIQGRIDAVNAELRLVEAIPEWKSLVFDGRKVDKDGHRVLNPKFYGWLDKQPKLTKAAYQSEDVENNIAVLDHYKESMAEEGKAEKDAEREKKLEAEKKKLKSPTGGKKEHIKGAKETQSYGDAFDEAAKKKDD